MVADNNKGLLAFVAGLGFAFLVPYIIFFTLVDLLFFGLALVSGIVAGVSVPLLLFAVFNDHVWSGFVSGLLVMSVVVVIGVTFALYGIKGVHLVVISVISAASVYSLLHAIRHR